VLREFVYDRWKIQIPRCGQEIRIIRKPDAQGHPVGGQVGAVYLATLEEGFFYSNPGRANVAFEPWENVERFDEPTK
jgi:hypothetical protein